MKSMHLVALALFAASAAAQASTVEAPDARTPVAAVVAAPVGKLKCIRGKEIGSNRTKRVCLPEEQMRKLTDAERADLLRADRPAADVLAD